MENGGWVGTYEDITERERAADALKEQHRRFDVALNNMAHGLCMFDADMRLIVSNKRYAEMFNLPPEFVRPGHDDARRSSSTASRSETTATATSPPTSSTTRYVASLKAGDLVVHRHLADGRIIKITHEPMAQGGWVAIYEDITERHRAEESIAHMARHDALTATAEPRAAAREDGRRARARRKRWASRWRCSISTSTISRASTTRSAIRSATSCSASSRSASAARSREGDTIARLGGDEFAILQCRFERRRRPARSRAGWSRSSPSRSRSTGRRSIPASASASRSRRTTATPPTT